MIRFRNSISIFYPVRIIAPVVVGLLLIQGQAKAQNTPPAVIETVLFGALVDKSCQFLNESDREFSTRLAASIVAMNPIDFPLVVGTAREKFNDLMSQFGCGSERVAQIQILYRQLMDEMRKSSVR